MIRAILSDGSAVELEARAIEEVVEQIREQGLEPVLLELGDGRYVIVKGE